ncbi:hypothetical protein B0T25DRAFT_583152 [Lasiosphaeria hispida]|uniref:Uncharacterized protein n=1 Tax=Lasiosphaeria hispida TaxID=260671 RepID=A0AAJ0HA54_9PEZI|nr:hypothetical protein B0T25DRAFT_583152 [Lasiosphaeria hispida]
MVSLREIIPSAPALEAPAAPLRVVENATAVAGEPWRLDLTSQYCSGTPENSLKCYVSVTAIFAIILGASLFAGGVYIITTAIRERRKERRAARENARGGDAV